MATRFDALAAQLEHSFGCYSVDAQLFRGPQIENDEQLPFDPNVVLGISDPTILETISELSPEQGLKDAKELFVEYGIDQFQTVLSVEPSRLPLALIQLEARLGLRICLLLCESEGELRGYRIMGVSSVLEKILNSALVSK